jgi:hypothetical protein
MNDDLDREARRLFDAARRELPSKEARERTLAAFAVVPRERRQRVQRWWVLGALAACSGAGLWLARQPTAESGFGIGPERPASEPSWTGTASVAKPPPVSSSEDSSRPPVPAPSVTPKRAPAPSGSVGLERELELLDDARNALASGNAVQALALLDRHRALRGNSLNAEATLLRIQALASAGRGEEAAALARSFIASNPNSLLADRARRFIHATPEAEASSAPSAGEAPSVGEPP